jgi:hypothetical protein
MKTKITTVDEYDSKKNQRLEDGLQEDIKTFKEFIKLHRKSLKKYANEEYPFKGIINFITVSMQFSYSPGKCRSLEAVIYPTINLVVPSTEDYLVEYFSTNEIGGRKVRFKVFGPEKKEKDSNFLINY